MSPWVIGCPPHATCSPRRRSPQPAPPLRALAVPIARWVGWRHAYQQLAAEVGAALALDHLLAVAELLPGAQHRVLGAVGRLLELGQQLPQLRVRAAAQEHLRHAPRLLPCSQRW
jgi:hypothetical protein